jgi:hypothetical protein
VIVGAPDGEPVLVGSTAAVWELLAGPLATAEVVARARAAYGLEAAATTAALDALAASGLCRST